MNFKRGFLLLTMLITFSFSARGPGATFLLIPPSARAMGMAYAYTAISDDAAANYYNTAGLAFLKSPKATLDYCGYQPGLMSDMHHIYFGLGYPLHNSAWGFDVIYFYQNRPEIRFDEGDYSDAWRLALKIIYSRRLLKTFSLGIAWKFINQYNVPGWWWYDSALIAIGIDPGGTGNSWAFDLNFLYKVLPKLSAGIILHNFGPDIRYTESGSDDPLPRLSRLGIAYMPIENRDFSCTFSAEVTKVLTGMFVQEENSFWEHLS